MPEYIVVRCYSCRIHQVIQENKKGKFSCKICTSAQSVKAVLASSSSSRELRSVVQDLNMKLRDEDCEREAARKLANQHTSLAAAGTTTSHTISSSSSSSSRWAQFCSSTSEARTSSDLPASSIQSAPLIKKPDECKWEVHSVSSKPSYPQSATTLAPFRWGVSEAYAEPKLSASIGSATNSGEEVVVQDSRKRAVSFSGGLDRPSPNKRLHAQQKAVVNSISQNFQECVDGRTTNVATPCRSRHFQGDDAGNSERGGTCDGIAQLPAMATPASVSHVATRWARFLEN